MSTDAPTLLYDADHGTPTDLNHLEGQQWGDFRFESLLGKGGMGTVWKGRQCSLDRPVAIKILPPGLAAQVEWRERFLREARSIAALSSPHIVQIYHIGDHAGALYYAMELLPGPDLGVRLRQGPQPTVEQAIRLIRQAAQGLSVAAKAGIVHRDIKPANMILASDSTLRVTDFGLVRRTGEHDLTSAGTIMGTTLYMSPEQATGTPCDSRSDLYSLGIVFYELVHGSPPFQGDDVVAVVYQHVHVDPPPLLDRHGPVNRRLQAIVHHMLAKRPEDRYQSADELLDDLTAYDLGRRPRHAPMAGPGSARWWVGGAVVLALGLAGTWWLQAEHRRTVAAKAQAQIAATHAAARQEREQVLNRDVFGPWALLVLPGAAIRLRELPAGTAMLGSPPDEAGRSRDETFVPLTFTRSRWMSSTEITQAQWTAAGLPLPPQPNLGPDLPVTQVGIDAIAAFCDSVTLRHPGLVLRLPTEAEWEFAGQGATRSTFADNKDLPIQGWFDGNAFGRLHPVGELRCTDRGFYDLHGNAAEWTLDIYDRRPSGAQVDPGPARGSGGSARVIKGGSYEDSVAECRIAARSDQRVPAAHVGFRVVATTLPDALTRSLSGP